MAITVSQAKELCSEAKIEVTTYSSNDVSYHTSGKISAHLDVMVTLPNNQRLFYWAEIKPVFFKDIDDSKIRIIPEPEPIDNCPMIKANIEEIDATQFSLGYYNAYDQPEKVEDWISQPRLFLASLISYEKAIKNYIKEHLKKHMSIDLDFKPVFFIPKNAV